MSNGFHALKRGGLCELCRSNSANIIQIRRCPPGTGADTALRALGGILVDRSRTPRHVTSVVPLRRMAHCAIETWDGDAPCVRIVVATAALVLAVSPCARRSGRRLLQGPADQADRRLRHRRRLRRLWPSVRPPSRPPHSRPTDRGRAEHAGRRQPARRQLPRQLRAARTAPRSPSSSATCRSSPSSATTPMFGSTRAS